MCPYVIGRNQDTIGVSEAEICHLLFCYSSSFCEQYFSALCRFNGRRDILRCADSTADETYQAARSIDRHFTTDSIL
jgi:hypothetical protein